MDWQWHFLDVQGRGLDPVGVDGSVAGAPIRGEFATQADAETWIGEVWRDLAEQGVDAVELWCQDSMIYGPMPLSA